MRRIVMAGLIIALLPLAGAFGGYAAFAAGPIALTGSGALAVPGTSTSYRLTINNTDTRGAEVVVAHTLPDGFAYVPDSTLIRINGQIVSKDNPSVAGRKLIWPALHTPAATYVSTSHFGIHTFVQDLCLDSYVDFQLDKALELVGEGGYVKQLFYSLKPSTTGPKDCWIQFVNGAYDRHLIPIIRLQGPYDGGRGYWVKPEADAPGDYTTIAQSYRRVVEGLPRRDGQTLYIEVWNEPELPVSWSNSPSAWQYGNFFVDVAAALHDIGDSRIKVLNGGLTPGNASFASELMNVPGFAQSFDLWAAHCYPYNHPPHYNIHGGSARYQEYTIDSYLLELDVLTRYGRPNTPVILTETGHGLGDNIFSFEGYPAINESNRADYMARAFRDYWANWSELVAVCPFELVGPYGDWGWLDWLYPTTDIPHEQYVAVAALTKPPLELLSATAEITFRAQVASTAGIYYSTLQATVDGIALPPVEQAAPVRLIEEMFQLRFPVILKGAHSDMLSDLETRGSTSPGVSGKPRGTLQYTVLESRTQTMNSSAQARTIDRLPIGDQPLALALDSEGRTAYVSRRGGFLASIDLSEGLVKDVWTLPIDLESLAFDGPGRRLYGVNSTEDTLFVLDLTTGMWRSSTMAGTGPVGIAVNSRKGRVYVACAENVSVMVLDGNLKMIDQVQVSNSPVLGLALDEQAGHIYVVSPLVPGRHGIAVLDEDSLQRVSLLGGDFEHPLSGLYGVTVDPVSGLIWGYDRGKWLVVDPVRRTLAQIGVQPENIPRAGFAFGPRGEKLYLLDSETGDLLIAESCS